jgi:hypothetical protein
VRISSENLISYYAREAYSIARDSHMTFGRLSIQSIDMIWGPVVPRLETEEEG